MLEVWQENQQNGKDPTRGKWSEIKVLISTWLPPKSENVTCSVVSDSVTPWTVAHQAPLSTEFSMQ